MDANIETKQTYLREEIIDKGYNPEIFSEFISSYQEGDFDLEKWTMNDIISIVNSFKHKFDQSINDNKDIPQSTSQSQEQNQEQSLSNKIENNQNQNLERSSEEITHVNQNDIIELDKKPLEEPMPIKTLEKNNYLANFSNVINCQKIEPTIFTDIKNLKIVVSNPELIKESIFSTAYYLFTITCEQANTSIKRKLIEFEKFALKLNDFFPGILIPYFPSKKVFEKQSNENIEKKLYYMQLFINSLCQTKVIRSSLLFHDFFTQTSKEWAKTMNLLNKNDGPSILTKFMTTKGIVNVEINESYDAKAILTEREMKTKSYQHDKITIAISNVMNEMSNLSNALLELSTAFNDMSKEYSISQTRNEYIENGYKALGKVMNDWSESYKKQKQFFKFELRYFFKFMQKELNLSSKLFDFCKNTKVRYVDLYQKLSKLPSITQQQMAELASHKSYFGYFLNKTNKEYDKLNKKQMNRFKTHFELLTERKTTLISDLVSFNNLLNWQF